MHRSSLCIRHHPHFFEIQGAHVGRSRCSLHLERAETGHAGGSSGMGFDTGIGIIELLVIIRRCPRLIGALLRVGPANLYARVRCVGCLFLKCDCAGRISSHEAAPVDVAAGEDALTLRGRTRPSTIKNSMSSKHGFSCPRHLSTVFPLKKRRVKHESP